MKLAFEESNPPACLLDDLVENTQDFFLGFPRDQAFCGDSEASNRNGSDTAADC